MPRALVIVDMLKDFVVPGGKLYVDGAEKIIPNIKKRLDAARREGRPVIFANDCHAPDDPEFELFPAHAVAGTPGAEIVPELTPLPGETVVQKPTVNAFHATDMELALEDRQVTEATVTGVVTHICVMEMVAGLRYRGIRSRVPRDCVADFDPGQEAAAFKRMQSVFGAEVV